LRGAESEARDGWWFRVWAERNESANSLIKSGWLPDQPAA
jgi:hypothetical protein